MLSVRNVEKSYGRGGLFSERKQSVLKGVSFECASGECLGIIGESGSGKSTLGRLILGLEKPDGGEVLFGGEPVGSPKRTAGSLSAVFQDYGSSINPFFTVEEAIAEPMAGGGFGGGKKRREDIDRLLLQVGLNASYRSKYPHELSGGEAQRVCIARAVSTRPRCILLDEAVSSLDVSVQIQVLRLLKELKSSLNMSYIFITHDIQAAAYLCDRIIIFREGRIEETMAVEHLKDVQSAYARKLLDALITF
ncbi:ABC transporter ATP-binding protein [Saccharibacillus alkalitolerans]|uniref:ABC transporter ATP-binding protein n=1 Tax=Saccharibacillus alkalitolerans TaxID=2705290 RepID=A0ABX0FC92_9BACL|nr:ABC transporter ATP-binding protein [Saccharibacillus alkalitolerans]NGZ77099.1 ABC transporter ATP-binding protein [Saccharibacillus alkalitolerans]